ncbi:MAG: hypothetical protein H6641_14375 [Caldilineaceae bacterium]|nr:hypothetical protein [Caldilineaceae bacterium]
MVAPSLAAQVGGANKASSNIDVKLLRYRQLFVDGDEYAPNDLPIRLLRHLFNFLWLYYLLTLRSDSQSAREKPERRRADLPLG